ncbi:Uncharacterised protein [Mycobacteroides abscessus subsp. massiliense]|nr:Uncharacterised protein [Mycobacteroides abscessus subsp. massiliense]SKO13912.1 Uncharacterised protein [Mycobacteroides abscessus subsp. massiliense]
MWAEKVIAAAVLTRAVAVWAAVGDQGLGELLTQSCSLDRKKVVSLRWNRGATGEAVKAALDAGGQGGWGFV